MTMKVKRLSHLLCFAVMSFAVIGVASAQQSDEEMLAEAQRKLNARVFGTQSTPQPSELDIYIENAKRNNIRPPSYPPAYWQSGYTCQDIKDRSYTDYRDCMYYFHVYHRYWDAPQVIAVAPVVVEQRQPKTISIDSFDEDALEDYYRALKTSVQFLGPISAFNKSNLDMMKKQAGFSSIESAWSLVIGQMNTAQIELDEWPLSAKQKGWEQVGSRITKYNKLFEQHSKTIAENDAFDESFKQRLSELNLLTEASFLN